MGWECIECTEFKGDHDLTSAGLPGQVVGGAKLVAPHGGVSKTSSGKLYKEQIVDENGNLTIIGPR